MFRYIIHSYKVTNKYKSYNNTSDKCNNKINNTSDKLKSVCVCVCVCACACVRVCVCVYKICEY